MLHVRADTFCNFIPNSFEPSKLKLFSTLDFSLLGWSLGTLCDVQGNQCFVKTLHSIFACAYKQAELIELPSQLKQTGFDMYASEMFEGNRFLWSGHCTFPSLFPFAPSPPLLHFLPSVASLGILSGSPLLASFPRILSSPLPSSFLSHPSILLHLSPSPQSVCPKWLCPMWQHLMTL